MVNERKEIGRSFIGISLYQNTNGKLKPTLINKSFNIPPEIIIFQLKLFVKMLEENYYPDFKDGVSTVNIDPEE